MIVISFFSQINLQKHHDEYMNDETKRQLFIEAEKSKERENIYTDVAKYLSLYGSVRLIDVVSQEDLFNAIVNRMREYINKSSKENVIDNVILF